ncbi:double-strand break repair helicase AddA [Sphingopyxis terrae]|uniref:DNA 3'-5' helicase n=1 Tax=Sphingopyxis terrae subsp. ummariensis TaxID=429001 RepID=A0A1Y6FPD2_9SPHN|nr:double-strand break repair helicase AddA [Sphingopyxis terrae]PCF91597.1 double-strand break repair helicase AddA [Sphingopyxis terrae subsp. ummariensis]SMQ76815.1 DNA helicase/exodeoxyribonuclease V, subunit A [Sphingopyxis terrae subsp. ummariensis]
MSKSAGLATLDPRQGAAADPESHVWLGASAGTGKTQVLSARVLRLMLDGVSPQAILCITFTKAGAAEMAHRIHERLATWVRMSDGDLRLDLHALGLDWERPGLMTRARSLFATVIDSPGGAIRVQTIHSFCQTLLASFPLEAKLLPGFRAIEEDEAAALKRQILGDLLEHDPDREALRAVAAMLSRRLGQESALAFLSSCAAVFGGPRAALPPAAHDLRAAFDLPGGDPDAWLAAEIAGGAISDADIKAVATSGAAWGTKTGEACSDKMVGWLTADASARAAMLDELLGCFLTGKGELRADFAGDKGRMTDCADSAVRIVDAAGRLRATATAMRVADDLAAGWKLGARFAEAYALAKREAGLADFDDLITLAGTLLRVSSFGEWVRFKLDQRTDHILVDEAQDTNMRQWGIVLSLAEEFFAGVSAKDDRLRTLFTVGDRKQAIFGFQGTEPKAFATARDMFHALGEMGGQPFRQVDLVSNYRSTPAVLDVVDRWLGDGGTRAMGLDGEEPPHRPFRSAQAGQVELWAPLPVGKAIDAAAAEDGGDEGDGSAPASDPASMRLAKAIAGEVQDWIANGKDGRPVAPGDIMILVRRRRDLAARIVARLQALHVPVAGVDRFALTQPLAVQDLIAAMRFAVQPLDDLNLAALLVSPLLGWTQDDLYARTAKRGRAAIWEHLRAHEDAMPPATMAALRALLGMADFTTPFRFLETVLSGPIDGRRKLYARLGREARDPIDELLSQALAFEARETVSLLGFLTRIAGSSADIKRQTEARSDVVRVMTVHGSKGLQAPIVILADATDDAAIGHRPFTVDVAAWEKLPVFAMPADERQGALAQAYQDAADAAAQEHWRLFYVAMTRAEEMLIVAGVTKKPDLSVPETSWHSAAAVALEGLGCDWEDAGPLWGRRRVHRVNDGKWARRDAAVRAAPPPLALPAWTHAPAPEEARPPRPLAPSALGEDDVAVPPQGSARVAAVTRGLLLHALFERLPPVATDRRRAAALRWLAVQAPMLGDAERMAMADEVLAILDDPAHAPLFGPDSLAEVPLSAVVDGMVVAGIVDRLRVTDDAVTVIDYKTGRRIPESAADVAPAYLRQMAAYRDALAVIFPGRRVETALLYTAGPRFIALDDAVLAPHKPGLLAAKANLPPPPLEPDAPTS